jgi:hypothetical protein
MIRRASRLLILTLLAALAIVSAPAAILAPLEWVPYIPHSVAHAQAQAPRGAAVRQTLPSVLPLIDGSVRFAVIGDMGTGGRRQLETGRMMSTVRQRFPYTFAITVGDNMYGGQDPSDYERKFVLPYKGLLDAGVMFYGSLGNHDRPAQRFFKLLNMNGERYYTFTRGPAQFFAIDSTLMTQEQLRWLERELVESRASWKIAYFHHPLYSSGRRHGPELVLRGALEPILAAHGVQVVFTGHEHFYERLTMQNGIQHFITGAGGQLRRGNIRRSTQTAAGFDQDNSFMVVELTDDTMWFESVSRVGEIVDAGIVDRKTGIRPTK